MVKGHIDPLVSEDDMDLQNQVYDLVRGRLKAIGDDGDIFHLG